MPLPHRASRAEARQLLLVGNAVRCCTYSRICAHVIPISDAPGWNPWNLHGLMLLQRYLTNHNLEMILTLHHSNCHMSQS